MSIPHKNSYYHIYGYHLTTITSSLEEKSIVEVVEDRIENQQEFLQPLKYSLEITKNKMKQQVDQHHNEREFEVQD